MPMGCEANWTGNRMAEDCSCRIPLIANNEHTRNDPVAVECLAIGYDRFTRYWLEGRAERIEKEKGS